MQLGIVGLGRMGKNMAERLRRHGHEVLGYSRSDPDRDVSSLEELIHRLAPPRVAWVMVPSGDPTELVISQLLPLMSPGDIIVDGGNSNFHDSQRRAKLVEEHSISFLDIGVSGGIWGLERGYCIMAGGKPEAFAIVEPALKDLAPPQGYAHVGPSGAGHFVKMVHNGIEYGMLQAYGEGFELLQASEFPLDLKRISTLWNQGSVVQSWLLELAERAFAADPELKDVRGYVEDSGEGRWTVLEAVNLGIPAPAIAASLFARFVSRQEDSFSMKVIAALRREFGGHKVLES